jgi:glycosyltransferase involved in cell wall biosynthesis
MSVKPRVTLAMPVYNGSRYVAEAIDSILAQTFEDFELIITDNKSTDSTAEICKAYVSRDSRIQYHCNSENLGAARNYNRGYELASGEYLKWCAHDDTLSPKFVERCVEMLDTCPDVSLAFARTQCIDQDGKFIDWDERSIMGSVAGDASAQRFYDAMTQAGTCFPIFGLFRMDALRRSTLHRLYYGSDRALIAEMAVLGKVVQVADDAVFYNREHQTRSINMVDPAARSTWQNTTAKRSASMEHVNLLAHFAEIAWRHPDEVSRFSALSKLAMYACTPRQLGRYALDLIRYVSPSGGAKLKSVMGGIGAARRST